MPKLETIQIRDLSNAIIQGVDNLLVPRNSVDFAYNIIFEKILGRGVVREGTALIGTQIVDAKNILGLYQFNLGVGTKYFLSVVDGTPSQTYRLESNVWTTTGADGQMTAGAKVRFLTYLDTVMMLDGTLKKSSVDGTAWITTGGNLDIGDCPAGKYLIEWKDRVYVAGVSANPDRLHYSSIPTAGVITWGSDYLDVEPMEGQGAITGLAKVPGYLLIFKERALKRWNGSSTFPDDLCRLGTPSQESVVLEKTTAFYFSSSYKKSIGFYETNGETTRKISRPIQKIIEAIPSANYSSIAGFSDGEMAMWSVGTLDYDGISYSNVVLYYHIDSKTWAVLGFPTNFKVFSSYVSGTDLKIAGGNDDGEIIELFTGTKDNWTGNTNKEIQYALNYHIMEFGSRGLLKNISKIIPYGENNIGCKFFIRVDNKTGFKEKGVISSEFGNEVVIDESGYIFQVRLAGQGLGGLTSIVGYDVVFPEISESIKK